MTIQQIIEKIRPQVQFKEHRGTKDTQVTVKLEILGAVVLPNFEVDSRADAIDNVKDRMLHQMARHLKDIVYPVEEERADHDEKLKLRQAAHYWPVK